MSYFKCIWRDFINCNPRFSLPPRNWERSALILVLLKSTPLGGQGRCYINVLKVISGPQFTVCAPSRLLPSTPSVACGREQNWQQVRPGLCSFCPPPPKHTHPTRTWHLCVYRLYQVIGLKEGVLGRRLLPVHHDRLPSSGHMDYISQLPLQWDLIT